MFYVYDYEQYKIENGININLFEELPGYTSKDIKDLSGTDPKLDFKKWFEKVWKTGVRVDGLFGPLGLIGTILGFATGLGKSFLRFRQRHLLRICFLIQIGFS